MAKRSTENWDIIRDAMIAGASRQQICDTFDVTDAALRIRISREKWPLPGLVLEAHAANELSKYNKLGEKQARKQTVKMDIDSLNEVEKRLEVVCKLAAASWQERAQAHREHVFTMAHEAMKMSKLKPPRTWKEMQIVDTLARKASGLESGDAQVNVGIIATPALGHFKPVIEAAEEPVLEPVGQG